METTTLARSVTLAAVLLLGATAVAPAQEFQWPDEAENLEVLPDTLGSDGLRRTMQHFTDALGVQCSFCHEGEEGAPLSEYEFASDENDHKQTARTMLRMVEAINSEHLEKLEHDHEGEAGAHAGFTLPPDREVNCVTCHRGTEHPAMIEDVLARVIERDGVGAAVERYEELREQHYGSYAYDFTVGPLSELARDLATRGQTDAAVRMAELEVKHHRDNYRARFVLAQMLDRAGDQQAAVESMKRALDLAPEDARPFLRRQLKRIRGG